MHIIESNTKIPLVTTEKNINSLFLKLDIINEKAGDAFIYIRELFEKQRNKLLIICFSMYIAGFILLLIVIVQNSILVVQSMIRVL